MILYRSWQTYIDARFSNKNTQSDSLPFDADFSGDYMDDIATQSAQFRSHQFKAPFMYGAFPHKHGLRSPSSTPEKTVPSSM